MQHTVIANALANTSAATFASVNYNTQIATAAAHKHNAVHKNVTANVTLFSNIKHANVYANALAKNANKTSAAQNASNTAIAQNMCSTHYEHTNCYSIVYNAQRNTYYLYCIVNNAQSVYYINNAQATKHQVAQLLTASAANKLLNSSAAQYNATHNVAHTLHLRTVKCSNINTITINKQTYTFN